MKASGMFRTACALGAVLAANPALAQTPGEKDLAALVRQQAAEIAELRARLDRLEGAQPGVDPEQTGPTTPQTATVTPLNQPAQNETPDRDAAQAEHDVAQAQKANSAGVTTEWGEGLPVFRSADGVFTFKPRGRILADVSSTFGSRDDGRNITTTGMRALRLGVEGGVGPHFFYQFESDFSENDIDVVTAYVGWRNQIRPGLNYDLRAGHLFNDRSFEGSTGSDATPFLERSVVASAIIPQRGFYGIGIMPRLFWKTGHVSLSLTGDRIDGNNTTSDSRTVLARAHWNPVKSDRGVLHLGLWGFDEGLSSAATTLTRNTIIGGRFNGALRVSTGPLLGGRSTTGYGAELGGYLGPLWAMGEAGERRARLDGGRPDFLSKAWSLSSGWFVTGERPPYSSRSGNFGQPDVLKPVFEGGPGAIELTARYENLDYTNLPTGGRGWAATAGANWYLNNFTRLQFNWVHWDTDNSAGAFTGADSGETIGTRIGVTF